MFKGKFQQREKYRGKPGRALMTAGRRLETLKYHHQAQAQRDHAEADKLRYRQAGKFERIVVA